MGYELQDAIKLYNSKNYNEALEEFKKLRTSNPQDLEIQKYLFQCAKNLKIKEVESYFNDYIDLLFNAQKYSELTSFIEAYEYKILLKNKIFYIQSLFKNGDVKKSHNLYLKFLEKYLEQKNYVAVNSLLKIEKEIIKYHPKVELVKLIYWSDLKYDEERIKFLDELEEQYTKNWKAFRDFKIDKNNFIAKIIEILNVDCEEVAELFIRVKYLELKYEVRKPGKQDVLEYLILNLDNVIRQSYIINYLDDETKSLYVDLVQSKQLDMTTKRNLAPGFFEFEKSKIVVTPNTFEDEISEVLKFDQLPTHVEPMEKEEKIQTYKLSKSEQEIIKKIENDEYENIESFIVVLIENSFLRAAELLAKKIQNDELKVYYLGEIYLKLQEWSTLIDHCFSYYENASVSLIKNLNYFLGIAFLEKNESNRALKYLNKVIVEDPNFRSIREKVEIAKSK